MKIVKNKRIFEPIPIEDKKSVYTIKIRCTCIRLENGNYCAGILAFSQIFLAIIAVLWYNKRNGGDILWQDQKNTKSNLRMMN